MSSLDFLDVLVTADTAQQTRKFIPYPEGAYLLKVTEVDEVTTKQGKSQVLYKSEIQFGPNNSKEKSGKKYSDRIDNDKEASGQHLNVFAACFGSEDAVRQMAAQYGGRLPAQSVVGYQYIAVFSVSGSFNNIVARLPYTTEKWSEALALAAQSATDALPNDGYTPPAMMPTPQAAAPAPAPAPMPAPPAAAPPMPMGAAPAAAPMPGMPYAPPAAPQMPGMPAPAAAPAGPPMPPMPPTVPGR